MKAPAHKLQSVATALFALLLFVSRSEAATNLISTEEIPPLRPPRGEIPPGFWEQHSSWVIGGSAAVVLLAAAAVWRLTRPKLPPAMDPPGVHARRALEPLRDAPETGLVLTRVSQVVRHYFTLSFGLPPVELTTTEFCRALAGAGEVRPELATAVGDFLRACDQRKFAPAPPATPMNAAATASDLIEKAEASRCSPGVRPGTQVT